ncbi:glycosyltransferase family 4 protein [Cyanobacteria bacterium FACHB-472]|nr:glycosyltransferase family 4 protein [Cyanobacteria bacterium FACHB-472]
MQDVVLNSGIAPEKVFLIPIGINLSYFQKQTRESRQKTRVKYGIPESAVVVGSFQKDGVGWDEGLQPKLIKGPDIFLKTIEILKPRVPELFVLLSGPARGYVKTGLETLGVPYHHCILKNYPEVGELFQALDLYIVASRQEGGPKALLESMASGVPLITTKVGQAMDLVQHEKNAWMVDVEDAEGLAYWAEYVITQRELDRVLQQGRTTAEANTYQSQIPLWRNFMKGFVEISKDV